MRHAMLLACSLVACADDHGVEAGPGADACEHFEAGPIEALTAGASAAEAVAAGDEHTRYDVTLGASGDRRGGFLEVPIAEAGEHVFYFDAPVTLSVRDGNGAEVAIERSVTKDDECAIIGAGFFLDLEVGSYVLEVGGASDLALVELVWFGVAEDGHDH